MKKRIVDYLYKHPSLFAVILNTFRDWYGFHEDNGIRMMVWSILDKNPVTSFVETGTARGDTAFLVSGWFPKLPLYTCELDKSLHLIAKNRMVIRKNVKLTLGNSVDFLIDNHTEFGECPFFFLDAHDCGDNPLTKELEIINATHKKAIILIDDVVLEGDKGHNHLEQLKPLLGEYQIVNRQKKSNTGYLLTYIGF